MKKVKKSEPETPPLTDEEILNFQIRQFSESWDALEKEEKELTDYFNIARNMAASELGDHIIPSSAGGFSALTHVKILPAKMDQLKKNYELLLTELSKRRYVLLLTYRPFLEKTYRWEWIKGKHKLPMQTTTFDKMDSCYRYWNDLK